MMFLSNRKALAVALASGAIGVGALIAACSGSTTTNNNPGGGNNNPDGAGTNPGSDDGGGNSTVNNSTPGSCASSSIPITFAPMYSAFIPGSTAQTFQIPAITDDGNTAAWSSSDPTSVTLAPDTTTGGVMITVTGVPSGGSLQIFAAEGSTCGASTLTITSNTEAQWQAGSDRYNDNITFGGPPDGGGGEGPHDGGFEGGGGFHPTDGGGSFLELDGGTACTNCHGPTANSLFKDVAHTPEQTGGFSDTDLVGIITQGIVPDGGYFDPSVLITSCTDAGTNITGNMTGCLAQAYARWQGIHQWNDISTSDEQAGIVCYLRSLEPEPQNGSSNFGGGGYGDGGTHHHHDGGTTPPVDSGSAPVDSGETEQ